jgi:copper oxidase (laccase) domain-containing protein
MPAVTASLEIITSPLLGEVRHGFFTRRGGASSGIFEGLNCGGGSSDQSAIVATNRDRVARAMDVPTDRLVTVHQAHTARAVTLSAPRRSRSRPTPSSRRPRGSPSRS